MNQTYRILTALFLVLSSCDDAPQSSIDKSLVEHIEKLTSPNSDYTLYRYFIKSSMAFGSGFTVIKILPSDKKCDFASSDFLKFGSAYPFWVKWKGGDTLSVKCVIADEDPSSRKATRKEIKKWKNFYFEIEYFSQFSTSAVQSDSFQTYSVDKDLLTFIAKSDTYRFKKKEVQLVLDTPNISILEFKIDTFESKIVLSSKYYDLKSLGGYKQKDFLNQQAFQKYHPD